MHSSISLDSSIPLGTEQAPATFGTVDQAPRKLAKAGSGLLLIASCLLASCLLAPSVLAADTLLLYAQDWESPNTALTATCAPQLDNRGVQLLYGGTVDFQQRFTVEAVLLDDPVFSDPSDRGGSAAVGMLATIEDDLLAISFDTGGRPFLNVSLDLAGLDVPGCGGPVGVEGPPALRLLLIDDPGGIYDLGSGPGPIPGTVLDSEQILGTESLPPTQYLLDWSSHLISLDASSSTDGRVVLILDATRPTASTAHYLVVDNLRAGASTETDQVPVHLLSFSIE